MSELDEFGRFFEGVRTLRDQTGFILRDLLLTEDAESEQRMLKQLKIRSAESTTADAEVVQNRKGERGMHRSDLQSVKVERDKLNQPRPDGPFPRAMKKEEEN